MPIIHIYLLEGRSEEKLERLVREVTEVVASILEVDRERVTVLLHELPASRIARGGITLEKRK